MKATFKNRIKSQQVKDLPIYNTDGTKLIGTFTGDVAWSKEFERALIGTGVIVSDFPIDHNRLSVDETADGKSVFCLSEND